MQIESESFGATKDDEEVTLWTVTNNNGMVVQLMDYGASVVRIEVPDRDGNMANVTLGFDELAGYEDLKHHYLGSTVGRYCNRIALGKFSIDGQEYELATNNPPNHLHGGDIGFNHVMWSGEEYDDEENVGVRFTYVSADGEEGYPGEVTATVTYSIAKASNQLTMDFTATTTKACPVNIANHCYWNLAGDSRDQGNTILDHTLKIYADRYLPVDETLIPTGELADVEGTPFDFREAKPIGQDIEQLRGDPEGSDNPGCYDHNFVHNESDSLAPLRATLVDPESGRKMDIYSTQPGVQFYTGNFLSGTALNSGYHQHAGLCLEMQHWPDSPNQPSFPNTILQPGETYQEKTIHLFSIAPE